MSNTRIKTRSIVINWLSYIGVINEIDERWLRNQFLEEAGFDLNKRIVTQTTNEGIKYIQATVDKGEQDEG